MADTAVLARTGEDFRIWLTEHGAEYDGTKVCVREPKECRPWTFGTVIQLPDVVISAELKDAIKQSSAPGTKWIRP